MATVIDQLSIALGLDVAGFKKGQKDIEEGLKKSEAQSTKSAKEMEAGGKKAATAFSKVRNEILALTTAMIGLIAVKSFVEKVTAGDAEMGRFANNVNASTEEVSTWVNAANKAGGSAEGMAASIQTLNDQMVGLHTLMKPVSGDVIQGLSLSGVDTNKYFDRATTITDKFLMLSDAFKGMDAAKAQGLGKMIGLDVGTVNMLMLGHDAVSKILEQQRRLNIVTEADAKAAQRRQVAWRNLMDTFEKIGRVILNQLSPVVLKLLNDFSKWLGKKENIDALVKSVRDIAKSLNEINFKPIIEGLGTIVKLAFMAAEGLGKITDFAGGTSKEEDFNKAFDEFFHTPEAMKKIFDVMGDTIMGRNAPIPMGNAPALLGITPRAGDKFSSSTANKNVNNSSDVKIGSVNIYPKDADTHRISDAFRNKMDTIFMFGANAQSSTQ